MTLIYATRDGKIERIPFVQWGGERYARLRVEGRWWLVETREDIVNLLKFNGYSDVHAPEIDKVS